MNLSWIFSIFKIPRISRAVSGCDAQSIHFKRLLWPGKPRYCGNVRSGRDTVTTFSIPDLKTTLASTSACIVNAGLNKVWRTESKAPSHGCPPEPVVCQVSSVEQDNEKQPEQGIIHPSVEPTTTTQPAPICPKASRHVSEELQVTPKPSLRLLKPVGRIPQPKRSTQRNVGLNLFTVSPSRSLLFLPPNPSPKRKTIFNPEEVTVPEPKSTTYPVESPPDDEFPINTLPTPSLPTDHTVPNTPSLSPLSIILSFSPLATPPPPEITIKIAGPEGYLNADDHKSQITNFLSSRATEVANSLVVIWQPSHIDSSGERGLMSLKSLFAQLDELDSDRTVFSRFSKLSITIPDLVNLKDVAPCNNVLLQPVEEDDSIDLANATTDLHEFAWHGDFNIFASKFKNISFFLNLKCLHIKSSNISIEDAITLLHSCSGLQTVTLGTFGSEKNSNRTTSIMSESMKSSHVERKPLPNLTYLALESDIALHPLIRRFRWTRHVSLNLTLRKQGTASLVQALYSVSQEQRCPYLAQLLSPGS